MLNNLALALKEDIESVNLAELNDKALVDEFLGGRSEAFDEIVRPYGTKIYRLALRITKNHHDAEDIRQNVFLTLLNKIGTFEGRSSFSSWLYRVTINACYMHLRRNKKDKNRVPFEESNNLLIEKNLVFNRDTPDESVFFREAWKKVQTTLAELDEGQKVVYLLADKEECNVREIAQILGLSIACIKSRFHHARYFLRNALGIELGNNHRLKPRKLRGSRRIK